MILKEVKKKDNHVFICNKESCINRLEQLTNCGWNQAQPEP